MYGALAGRLPDVGADEIADERHEVSLTASNDSSWTSGGD
jgi:hypothetical protein